MDRIEKDTDVEGATGGSDLSEEEKELLDMFKTIKLKTCHSAVTLDNTTNTELLTLLEKMNQRIDSLQKEKEEMKEQMHQQSYRGGRGYQGYDRGQGNYRYYRGHGRGNTQYQPRRPLGSRNFTP